MTEAGWYPDPHGGPDLRWWDGTTWTEQTSPGGAAPGGVPGSPLAAPPAGGPLPPPGASPSGGFAPPGAPGVPPGPGVPSAGFPSARPPDQANRQALIVGGVGVTLVLVLATLFVLTRDDGGEESTTGSTTTASVTATTSGATTTTTSGATTTTADPNTVSSGVLSFDRQGDPWEDIVAGGSLPQGEIVDVTGQQAPTQEGSDWYSTLLIGTLGESITYDGEASLPDATHALAESLIANYYRGGVTATQIHNETEVNPDGHPGYFVHYELTIDLPDVADDREKLIVVVVDTGGDRPAAFWGSIPYTREDLNTGLDAAYASLAVA